MEICCNGWKTLMILFNLVKKMMIFSRLLTQKTVLTVVIYRFIAITMKEASAFRKNKAAT